MHKHEMNKLVGEYRKLCEEEYKDMEEYSKKWSIRYNKMAKIRAQICVKDKHDEIKKKSQ